LTDDVFRGLWPTQHSDGGSAVGWSIKGCGRRECPAAFPCSQPLS